MKKGRLPVVSIILAIFSLLLVNLVVSEDGGAAGNEGPISSEIRRPGCAKNV